RSREEIMKRLTVLGTVSVFALLAYLFAPKVQADVRNADQWDMRTIITFRQPVEVPGKVLPAGTYVFTTMDWADIPQVVRIFNQDETNIVGTYLTLPAYTLHRPATTVITYEERPNGRPAAIKTWWYPNDLIG